MQRRPTSVTVNSVYTAPRPQLVVDYHQRSIGRLRSAVTTASKNSLLSTRLTCGSYLSLLISNSFTRLLQLADSASHTAHVCDITLVPCCHRLRTRPSRKSNRHARPLPRSTRKVMVLAAIPYLTADSLPPGPRYTRLSAPSQLSQTHPRVPIHETPACTGADPPTRRAKSALLPCFVFNSLHGRQTGTRRFHRRAQHIEALPAIGVAPFAQSSTAVKQTPVVSTGESSTPRHNQLSSTRARALHPRAYLHRYQSDACRFHRREQHSEAQPALRYAHEGTPPSFRIHGNHARN